MAAALVVLLVLLSEAAAGEVKDVVHLKPGDDVTLTCRADGDIRAVEWTKEDLGDKYVLFYRDGQAQSDYQHPSFRDRVQLFGSELKDGNASLLLKNVNSNDTGTYKCGVASGGSRRKRAAAKIISRVHLEVSGPDRNPPDGNVGVGVAVGFLVGVLVCSAVVVLFLVRKKKRQTVQKPEASAASSAAGDHLI